jgi:hypothetical protein
LANQARSRWTSKSLSAEQNRYATRRFDMSALKLIIVSGVAATLTSGAAAQVARFTTSDSTILKDARTVFIESGYLPGEGLVVIRPIESGRVQMSSLGQAMIRAGEFRGVRVKLQRPARQGEALLIVLYADQGRRGLYDGDPVVLTVPISADVVSRATTRG